MKPSVHSRLLRREIGTGSRASSIGGLYGDRAWVDELDIVCELGHTQNIFSVKFMPHSNDKTLITCAGDAEVRVFDIEYSGDTSTPSERSGLASSVRGQRFSNLFDGVRYLSDGNTNARVYRSHADRVKRIVTESSPNVFLTCSEDGEVRQFDLRLPSSAYPAPRGGRGLFARRARHDSSNVPPPLISYKKFNLDLNTISCSGSQPHYIALGGAHLHCFLHDRRMLGRDRLAERGRPGNVSPTGSTSSRENDSMNQATQCVRKFAPNGRRKLRRRDNWHITACKISDANPNEMIASWSGEHIYSFDLIRSPDAMQEEHVKDDTAANFSHKARVKDSKDRKRKRKKADSPVSTKDARMEVPRPRRATDQADDASHLAVRVRYESGRSEDIAMTEPVVAPPSILEGARESMLNEAQKRSMQIAKSLVKIRQHLFSLDVSQRSIDRNPTNLTAHKASFTSVLGLAAACLPEMDEIIRHWRYPINPDEEEVVLQQTLRANRDSSRRFVQAAGTISRLLGGKLQTAGRGAHPALQLFEQINPAPQEGPHSSPREIFGYDFLKAISVWLEGGPRALLQAFKRPSNQRNEDPRLPIPNDGVLSDIHNYLIPYLLRLSRETPIPNVDASRFEVDERRKAFKSESSAVIAFSNAIRMPVQDLSRAVVPAPLENIHGADPGTRPVPATQDRTAALNFWAFKVARGVLLNAGEGVNFQFVDTAFGGLGTPQADEGREQQDINPDEKEELIDSVSVVRQSNAKESASPTIESSKTLSMSRTRRGDNDVPVHESSSTFRLSRETATESEAADSASEVVPVEDLRDEITEQLAGNDNPESDGQESTDEDDYDSDDDEDADITAEERHFMFQSAADRGNMRPSVEADVPCYSHSRRYHGHCNVRTVKDCNFFGLQDEYVVSGSDSGHLFIWDKYTSELVNILEGDGEVVNVVQGHPYEPVIAVSGIDHTIKIFSPDSHAQEDARLGINGTMPRGSSGSSSISGRHRRAQRTAPDDESHHGLRSRKRMNESYQITSQNDAERQSGMRDAFLTVRREGPFIRIRTVEVAFREWISWFQG
ncbi:MAG: hypothetical protein Q9191_001866 [Dirinaria sp. TL-2023a]